QRAAECHRLSVGSPAALPRSWLTTGRPACSLHRPGDRQRGLAPRRVSSLMDVTYALPRGAPLTYDDLQAMPDDGHRYEPVDGVRIVTPARLARDQGALLRPIPRRRAPLAG